MVVGKKYKGVNKFSGSRRKWKGEMASGSRVVVCRWKSSRETFPHLPWNVSLSLQVCFLRAVSKMNVEYRQPKPNSNTGRVSGTLRYHTQKYEKHLFYSHKPSLLAHITLEDWEETDLGKVRKCLALSKVF